LPPTSPLFPYTTLFRSSEERCTRHAPPHAVAAPLGLRPRPLPSQPPRQRQLHLLLQRRLLQRRLLLQRPRLRLPHLLPHPLRRRDRKSTRLNSSHVKSR